jgi:hypothetical protein
MNNQESSDMYMHMHPDRVKMMQEREKPRQPRQSKKPRYEQPRHDQPRHVQPMLIMSQPGYEQPGYEQPGYEQPQYEQPGYEQYPTRSSEEKHDIQPQYEHRPIKVGKPSKYSPNGKNKEKYMPKSKLGKPAHLVEADKIAKKTAKEQLKIERKLKKEKRRAELERQHAINPPKPKLKSVLEDLREQQIADRAKIEGLEAKIEELTQMMSKLKIEE